MGTNLCFGEYLKVLIKERGLRNEEFYKKLGINKPYFYDILAGRMKPPPAKKQYEMIEILDLNKEEKYKFFDLAAAGRKEIPADIVKFILNNKDKKQVRKNLEI